MIFAIALINIFLAAASYAATAPVAHHSLNSFLSRSSGPINWAGAIYDSYGPDTFKAVEGTFTLPTPTSPNGHATILLGLDDSECDTSFMAGVDVVYNDGEISYTAVYGWYPDTYNTTGISLHPGDQIRVVVVGSTIISGLVSFQNLMTNEVVSETIKGANPLCFGLAGWIVQQPRLTGGGLASLNKFGTVTFTGTSTYMTNGSTSTAASAGQADIEGPNGTPMTAVSIASNGDVSIRYIAS